MIREVDTRTIFSNILLSAPLMDHITSYQCGIYGGLRSLQRQARHYGPTLLVDGDALLLDSLTMAFLPWCSSSRHVLKASRVLTMFHPLLEYLVMYIGELSMLEIVYENGGLQAVVGRDYLRLALSLWHPRLGISIKTRRWSWLFLKSLDTIFIRSKRYNGRWKDARRLVDWMPSNIYSNSTATTTIRLSQWI
ncbi:hypothetical protein Ae201684P_009557 [Aphanomyces euteiches]|nr:hypothetical protein Ae201684P_009557 [Aphanomyces euteiches]